MAERFSGLHHLGQAAELRAPETTPKVLSPSQSPIGTGQSSTSRTRPILPPIDPGVSNQHTRRTSSPSSGPPLFSSSRSFDLHQTHPQGSPRWASVSPASTHGPETPVHTLPPFQSLTNPFNPASKASQLSIRSPSSFATTGILPKIVTAHQDRGDGGAELFSGIGQSPRASFAANGLSSPDPTFAAAYYSHFNNFMVPIDVKQGSRSSDEKRKRNAGASARFRLRRKEKEEQAVEKIAQLQERVKELEELVEWYGGELEDYRQILANSGLEHLKTRISSNNHQMRTLSSSTRVSPAEYQQRGERGIDTGRNQRRKTDYSETSRAVYEHRPPFMQLHQPSETHRQSPEAPSRYQDETLQELVRLSSGMKRQMG